MKLGRGLPVFSFSSNGYHPYVRAILAALKNPHKESKNVTIDLSDVVKGSVDLYDTISGQFVLSGLPLPKKDRYHYRQAHFPFAPALS